MLASHRESLIKTLNRLVWMLVSAGILPAEMSMTEAPSNVDADVNTPTNQPFNSVDPGRNDGGNGTNHNPDSNTNPETQLNPSLHF